jgi:hypothetical protein
MSQPLLQQPTRVDWHTRIDLNRATDGSQVEFVADSDATLVHERLWQRDLKLARHFRHGNSVGVGQGSRQGQILDAPQMLPPGIHARKRGERVVERGQMRSDVGR